MTAAQLPPTDDELAQLLERVAADLRAGDGAAKVQWRELVPAWLARLQALCLITWVIVLVVTNPASGDLPAWLLVVFTALRAWALYCVLRAIWSYFTFGRGRFL